MAPTVTYLPTMLMTLVRRVSSKLPYNHFLFRVAPQYTKAEIKEYLEKVYNVQVSRITTSISLGALQCALGQPHAHRAPLTAGALQPFCLTAIASHPAPPPLHLQAKLAVPWASAPCSTSSRTTSVPWCSCATTGQS